MTNVVCSALDDIKTHLEPSLNGRSIDAVIGERLAEFVGRTPPWSRQMINGVRNAKQAAPRELYHAIMGYVLTLDDVHPLRAIGKPVDVLAVGDVHPGAIILADDRPCAYPLCNVRFVPRTPTQRHCTRDCQVRNYRLRKSNVRKK